MLLILAQPSPGVDAEVDAAPGAGGIANVVAMIYRGLIVPNMNSPSSRIPPSTCLQLSSCHTVLASHVEPIPVVSYLENVPGDGV
jgi:hypothetical protein